MAEKSLHILQHALGVDQYGQGRQYRRYFVTGPGTDDWSTCCELVAKGLMEQRPPSDLSGGGHVFLVTQSGVAFVAENSPARPKVSRSKQRYLDFLDADSGLRFGEWIRLR